MAIVVYDNITDLSRGRSSLASAGFLSFICVAFYLSKLLAKIYIMFFYPDHIIVSGVINIYDFLSEINNIKNGSFRIIVV